MKLYDAVFTRATFWPHFKLTWTLFFILVGIGQHANGAAVKRAGPSVLEPDEDGQQHVLLGTPPAEVDVRVAARDTKVGDQTLDRKDQGDDVRSLALVRLKLKKRMEKLLLARRPGQRTRDVYFRASVALPVLQGGGDDDKFPNLLPRADLSGDASEGDERKSATSLKQEVADDVMDQQAARHGAAFTSKLNGTVGTSISTPVHAPPRWLSKTAPIHTAAEKPPSSEARPESPSQLVFTMGRTPKENNDTNDSKSDAHNEDEEDDTANGREEYVAAPKRQTDAEEDGDEGKRDGGTGYKDTAAESRIASAGVRVDVAEKKDGQDGVGYAGDINRKGGNTQRNTKFKRSQKGFGWPSAGVKTTEKRESEERASQAVRSEDAQKIIEEDDGNAVDDDVEEDMQEDYYANVKGGYVEEEVLNDVLVQILEDMIRHADDMTDVYFFRRRRRMKIADAASTPSDHLERELDPRDIADMEESSNQSANNLSAAPGLRKYKATPRKLDFSHPSAWRFIIFPAAKPNSKSVKESVYVLFFFLHPTAAHKPDSNTFQNKREKPLASLPFPEEPTKKRNQNNSKDSQQSAAAPSTGDETAVEIMEVATKGKNMKMETLGNNDTTNLILRDGVRESTGRFKIASPGGGRFPNKARETIQQSPAGIANTDDPHRISEPSDRSSGGNPSATPRGHQIEVAHVHASRGKSSSMHPTSTTGPKHLAATSSGGGSARTLTKRSAAHKALPRSFGNDIVTMYKDADRTLDDIIHHVLVDWLKQKQLPEENSELTPEAGGLTEPSSLVVSEEDKGTLESSENALGSYENALDCNDETLEPSVGTDTAAEAVRCKRQTAQTLLPDLMMVEAMHPLKKARSRSEANSKETRSRREANSKETRSRREANSKETRSRREANSKETRSRREANSKEKASEQKERGEEELSSQSNMGNRQQMNDRKKKNEHVETEEEKRKEEMRGVLGRRPAGAFLEQVKGYERAQEDREDGSQAGATLPWRTRAESRESSDVAPSRLQQGQVDSTAGKDTANSKLQRADDVWNAVHKAQQKREQIRHLEAIIKNLQTGGDLVEINANGQFKPDEGDFRANDKVRDDYGGRKKRHLPLADDGTDSDNHVYGRERKKRSVAVSGVGNIASDSEDDKKRDDSDDGGKGGVEDNEGSVDYVVRHIEKMLHGAQRDLENDRFRRIFHRADALSGNNHSDVDEDKDEGEEGENDDEGFLVDDRAFGESAPVSKLGKERTKAALQEDKQKPLVFQRDDDDKNFGSRAAFKVG